MFVLAAGLQSSRAFSLLGPETPSNGADNWQTAVIGYHLAYADSSIPGGPMYLGDIGGPRNLGEEYRRNVPIVYYTYDTSFLGFFGSNGVAAVDSAVALMNTITNVDQIDPSQYPLDSQQYNYEAEALYLTDLKSTALHLLVEQLGLAQPERFTYTLQERILPPGGKCPVNEEYLVVQRNYEYTNTALNQIQYSSYVNNVLYTYEILEICSGPDPLAVTLPFSVDPLGDQYTAVADSSYEPFGGLQIGGFYNTFTRDDIAGLKYLMSTNNINFERATPGSLLFDVSTNFAGGQTLFPVNPNVPLGVGTYNYGTLMAAAAGTPPALLQALFPGLVVSSSQNYFIVTNVPTVSAYYGPPPAKSPYGSPPVLVVVTNYTPTPLQQYVTKFANVVTQYSSTSSPAILQTITTAPPAKSPYGTPSVSTTNYSRVTLNGVPSGSFYILPNFGTNLCPPGILYTLLTNVIYTTNLITSATTNVLANTNLITSSNSAYSTTMSLITWYTNYTYVTYAVNCAQTANATSLYEGIQGVQFVREDYDSLLGQFFQPVTNGYSMNVVTNNHVYTRHFDRTVAAPEILFTAYDFVAANTFNGTVSRSVPNWDESQLVAGGLAGPGVIDPAANFQFNGNGSAFWNGYDVNDFLTPGVVYGETTQVPSLAWASFDESTNDPVVYPNGTSLANLASQVLIQVTPTSLPNGTNNVAYSVQFSASAPRLTPPFTWSAGGLPPGLTMSSTGLLSGTPINQTGNYNSPLVYDITVVLTDALSNSVQWTYPITIQ